MCTNVSNPRTQMCIGYKGVSCILLRGIVCILHTWYRMYRMYITIPYTVCISQYHTRFGIVCILHTSYHMYIIPYTSDVIYCMLTDVYYTHGIVYTFIGKVIFICLRVSVNLVYKFQGKPGNTTVKHDFNPNGLKFHRGSSRVSILS